MLVVVNINKIQNLATLAVTEIVNKDGSKEFRHNQCGVLHDKLSLVS